VLSIFIQPASASAPVVIVPEWDRSNPETLIYYYADKYSVSRDVMYHIVEKETAHTFDETIQSGYFNKGYNAREKSFGLAQIHLPAHPSVSLEEAKDPHFALNFLASNLSKGKCSMWTTCPL